MAATRFDEPMFELEFCAGMLMRIHSIIQSIPRIIINMLLHYMVM